MTRGIDDRLERGQVRDEAEVGEEKKGRGGAGVDDQQSRVDEAGGEAVLKVANAAMVSSGDVARSVETARRAAVMDVVPAWATVGRDGPLPDIAPPRAVARVTDGGDEDGGDEGWRG